MCGQKKGWIFKDDQDYSDYYDEEEEDDNDEKVPKDEVPNEFWEALDKREVWFANCKEEDLFCSVCLEIKDDPYSCLDCGQVHCSECYQKVKGCTYCSGPKERICRNLALKRVITGLNVKAKKEAQVQTIVNKKEAGEEIRSEEFDDSQEARAKQYIEFLFGDENYFQDDYLRGHENPEGWIYLNSISGFKDMKLIGLTTGELAMAVKHSTIVETMEDEWGFYIRRKKHQVTQANEEVIVDKTSTAERSFKVDSELIEQDESKSIATLVVEEKKQVEVPESIDSVVE